MNSEYHYIIYEKKKDSTIYYLLLYIDMYVYIKQQVQDADFIWQKSEMNEFGR
jgi:hypothetical protein